MRRAALALLFLSTILAGPGAGQEEPAAGLPPAPDWASPDAGLTGCWEVWVRRGDGRTASRVVFLDHDPVKGTVGVVNAPGDHPLSGYTGDPHADLFFGQLAYISWQLEGGHLLAPEAYSSYAGTFSADLEVKDWATLEGWIRVAPHWVRLKKHDGPFENTDPKTLRARWRRLLPRVNDVRPRVVTFDDLRENEQQVTIRIRGENLPVKRLLKSDYPRNNVHLIGNEVAHRGFTHGELYREIEITVEVDPDAVAGPRGFETLGRRFPDAFRLVETSKRLRLVRRPSYLQRGERAPRPVSTTGFLETGHARLLYPEGEAPESDELSGRAWVEYPAVPEDGIGAGKSEVKPLTLVRQPGERESFFSNEEIIFSWPGSGGPSLVERPYRHVFAPRQHATLVLETAGETARIPVYDRCWEIEKRLKRLKDRIYVLDYQTTAFNYALEKLRGPREEWQEAAALTPNAVDELKKLNGKYREYVEVDAEHEILPHLVKVLDEWFPLVVEGSAFAERMKVESERRMKALDKALEKLEAIPSRRRLTDLALAMIKMDLASSDLKKGVAPIPDSIFPPRPRELPEFQLDGIYVDVSELVKGGEVYRYPSENVAEWVSKRLSRFDPKGSDPRPRFGYQRDSNVIIVFRDLKRPEMREVWELADATMASADLEKEFSCLSFAYFLAQRLRNYREVWLTLERRAWPSYIGHAKAVIERLDLTRKLYRGYRDDMELERSALQARYDRLFGEYMDCVTKGEKRDLMGAAFGLLKSGTMRQLESLEEYATAREKELDAAVLRLENDFGRLGRKVRKMFRVLERAQDVTHLQWKGAATTAITGLDVAMVVWAVSDLAKGGIKYGARKWREWADGPIGGDELLKRLGRSLKDEAEEIPGLAKKIEAEGLSRNEVGELLKRMQGGKPFDEALGNVLARRGLVDRAKAVERLGRAGMSETDVGKLLQRVGGEGLTEDQFRRFAGLVGKLNRGSKAEQAEAAREMITDLRSTIEDLQRHYGIDLPVLSVGSGTEVDKLWTGALDDVSDLSSFQPVRNDWDGAFFFRPDREREQVGAVLSKMDPGEVAAIERELRLPGSLAETEKRLADLQGANPAMAERVQRRLDLLRRSVAQRKIEKDFHRFFTKKAGYPPTAPDFNLFSDNPMVHLRDPKLMTEALEGKVNLLRYVEKGPDGVFFTPGGKKYIELMRTGDRPILLGREGAKPVSDAMHEALITKGKMNPADGADLMAEMGGFYYQNLYAKYHLTPEDLMKVGRGTDVSPEVLERATKAAKKTAKYYLRAALGRIAAHGKTGERLPELFAAAKGSPEERIFAIAEELARKENLFSSAEIGRLKKALAYKLGGRKVQNGGKDILYWGADLKKWFRESRKASDDYFKSRMDEILKDVPPGERAARTRMLDDRERYHRYARDTTLSRLAPEALRRDLGLGATDASRIGSVRKNPYVAPLTKPGLAGALETARDALGRSNTAATRHLAADTLQHLAEEQKKREKGALSFLDFPPDWRATLVEMKEEGGVSGWTKYLTNATVNSFLNPFEALARAMLMVYEYFAIDREAHEQVGSMGLHTHGLEMILEDLERAVEETPKLHRLERAKRSLPEMEGAIRRFGEQLQDQLAHVKGERAERLRRVFDYHRDWVRDTWRPRKDAVAIRLVNLAARGVRVEEVRETMGTNLSMPDPGGGGTATRTMVRHWIACVKQMRHYIVTQATYYQNDYVKSPRVIGPLALLNQIAKAWTDELATLHPEK